MEKKQLNFSAPLMSARRYSSPIRTSGEQEKIVSPPKYSKSIPSQKPDVNLGEVVKPGSVPFIWEQVPGKAKGGNDSQTRSPHESHEVPTTPKLPPSMPFPPGKKSGELNGYRTPNKLSGELVVLRPQNKLSGESYIHRPRNFSGELVNLSSRNKLSGELNIPRSHKFSGEINSLRPYSKLSGELKTISAKFYTSNDMVKWDSSKEGTEMNESSESEDDDTTFSDATETFSQHESFSINCSVSGLSQSEPSEIAQPPETKLPNNLPRDSRTRDFMMNRFLPAAKAMTLEPSQYSTRKQLISVEQPKEVKALVPRAMTPPSNANMCKIVPYTGQDIGSEESEDEEDSYERSTISIKVKACGFLPWFCSKISLRLVNPLPSMKERSRSALSSASKLSKLVKTKSWQAPTQKLVKEDPNSNPKQVREVYKSCELQKLPKYTPRPMFYSGELQTRSGSPYRNSRRSNVSPFRNETPRSIHHKGVGSLVVPRQLDSYGENQSKVTQTGSKRFEEPGRNTGVSRTRAPIIEKTQYVDSVNITKASHSILNLPKTKRQVDLSVEEAVRLEYGGRLELLKARGRSGPLVYSRFDSSESSRISEKGNTNACRDMVLASSDDDAGTIQASLALPLPKAPSESWLSRQYPSVTPRVSPRNSVTYSSINSKILSRRQSATTPTSGAKWENIVKSSHLRQDHGRYSEELVTHVSQQARIWK